MNRPHVLGDERGNRFEFRKHLQARLSLPRLGCFGAEPVDEGLHVLALRLLLLDHFLVEQHALATLTFEG